MACIVSGRRLGSFLLHSCNIKFCPDVQEGLRPLPCGYGYGTLKLEVSLEIQESSPSSSQRK